MNASEIADLNHTESFKHIISWDQFQLLTFKNFNHSPSIKKHSETTEIQKDTIFFYRKKLLLYVLTVPPYLTKRPKYCHAKRFF